MPETAIDPNTYFTFYKDTLQEGEMVKLAIATRNIGPVDFPDSLAVAYWIIDNERFKIFFNNNLFKLKF